MPPSDASRVLVCALGGTIAMTGDPSTGVRPTESAQDLVAAVPGLDAVAEVETRSVRTVPGAHLSIDDVVELATLLDDVVPGRYSGAVVTQGTDTLEETAFALDVLWTRPEPVIFTGAMRNPTLPGADGPANLLGAVTIAASTAAVDCGVLVVMGDEIHAARSAHKAHATRPSAFVSAGTGPIGIVSEGDAHIWAAPRRPWLMPIPQGRVPAVGLVRLGLGDDGRLVRAATEVGYAALVVEALGGGHASPDAAAAIEEAAHKVPVVLASRTGAGPVLRRTYGFVGSEIDLLRRGVIPAGTLDGLKARILLTMLLASGADVSEITSALSR